MILMTEAEFKKHLEAAEKSPKEIAVSGIRIIQRGVAPQALGGQWCVLEVLGHLADVEIVYGCRLLADENDEKPVIAPMDQNTWLYGGSCPGTGCVLWPARQHNSKLLLRLKVADLRKSAFHPEMQCEVTVADIKDERPRSGAFQTD
jgi:hypothetical protein